MPKLGGNPIVNLPIRTLLSGNICTLYCKKTALYFLHGKSLEVDWFSAGQDRNGYGYFGGNIGLALHKLENHFLPMKNQNPILREEILTSDAPILIFQDADDKGYFKKATLYNASFTGNVIKVQEMLQKRGFELILQ